MSKLDGQCYRIVVLALGFVAGVTACVGSALGSGTPGALSAPTIEHFDDGRSPEMQLKQPGTGDSESSTAGGGPRETDLMLVTRQSCRLPFGQTPLSAIPLLGGSDRAGEWVLIAGVSWNKDSGFGAKGPVLIETRGEREPVNWYFTVEMLFIPEGRWNIRASLSIDGEELHDAIVAPDLQLNPLQIGIAIAFDHGLENPLVLNLGYGHTSPEGRVLSVRPEGDQPGQVLNATRIFSACLNIQW